MYPRNAATPAVIDLGEIVLKADGTQQTTGVSARVKIGTGAWGTAANSPACDATSGIWTYGPSQAETNADFFIVALYKASCTSISKTVITSNSATSGTVLLAPVTHTSAVLPNLDAAISSRMASYTQPTGFLAATFPATVSSFAGGVVASVTAGVTLAATQPAITFGALAIDVSGSTPNITLAGSGSGNGIEWTRSGSGNPFDSDVVDQIQSGLSTIDASGVRSAVGLASANLDTQLGDIPTLAEFEARSIVAANYATSSALSTVEGKIDTIDNFIDTEIAAIKTKTDQLTFTTPNKVDSTAVLDSAARVTLAASQPDYDLPTNTELNAALAASDDATLAAIAAEAVKTSAIKAKTDNLPTDPADQSLVEAAITAATSPLATPAQVNAEVLDVLSVDTFAELSAPPAATSSLKDKLTWLFMYARNKVTQTAIARTLYRDDTTTVAGTSATSDNGTTFTKGEDT